MGRPLATEFQVGIRFEYVKALDTGQASGTRYKARLVSLDNEGKHRVNRLIAETPAEAAAAKSVTQSRREGHSVGQGQPAAVGVRISEHNPFRGALQHDPARGHPGPNTMLAERHPCIR